MSLSKNKIKTQMIDSPYKTTFKDLQDMQSYVGKEMGLSEWMAIDQTSINQFATLTKDEQWIHVDPEQCEKHSPFKQPIAHGFLVLSLCTHLGQECYQLEGAKMGINYGFDKVRFINTTRVGAKIRGRFTLLDFSFREDGGAKFKMGVTVEIEGEEKPACVAEWIGLAYA